MLGGWASDRRPWLRAEELALGMAVDGYITRTHRPQNTNTRSSNTRSWKNAHTAVRPSHGSLARRGELHMTTPRHSTLIIHSTTTLQSSKMQYSSYTRLLAYLSTFFRRLKRQTNMNVPCFGFLQYCSDLRGSGAP